MKVLIILYNIVGRLTVTTAAFQSGKEISAVSVNVQHVTRKDQPDYTAQVVLIMYPHFTTEV